MRHQIRKTLLFAALALGLGAWTYKHIQGERRQHALSLLPGALGVSSILYSQEYADGYGLPGDASQQFYIYALPERIAIQIQAGGLAFLQASACCTTSQTGGIRRRYEWHETPMSPTAAWQSNKKSKILDVRDQMCSTEGCIMPIAEGVIAQANAIINVPNGFYARDGRSSILVSPTKRLVVYFYSGN
ncbi:hypothetical protein ACQUJO_16975 [Ralstonia pseudosolanacearum]